MRPVDSPESPGGPHSQSKMSLALHFLLDLQSPAVSGGPQCCKDTPQQGPDSSFLECKKQTLGLWGDQSSVLFLPCLWWSFVFQGLWRPGIIPISWSCMDAEEKISPDPLPSLTLAGWHSSVSLRRGFQFLETSFMLGNLYVPLPWAW